MPPSLDIVIVNWNTGTALHACVASIAAGAAGIDLQRLVVVDNGSHDGSIADAAAAGFPLTVIENRENHGFGAACNQGARGSNADYLLFLNPDTRLEPTALAHTLAFLDAPSQHDVGVCGIRLLDDHGAPTTTAARFPTARIFFGEATGLRHVLPGLFPRHRLTGEDCAGTRDVDQVIGAFFVIRRALFERLRGFDERFFVYFEEVDLSLRVRQAGFRSTYFDGATAFHTGGLSSDQVRAARLFYALRSRLLYAWKHFAFVDRWAVLVTTFAVEWPARMLVAFRRGDQAPKDTFRAFQRLFAFVATRSWRTSLAVQRAPMA